jgi:hypothetical protein
MPSRTLSYYADESMAAWMNEQATIEGRSVSQIIGDALRFYRGLPDEARRVLRVAQRQGTDGEALRAAARTILLRHETENRQRVAEAIRASERELPDDEDALLEEAVRLAR